MMIRLSAVLGAVGVLLLIAVAGGDDRAVELALASGKPLPGFSPAEIALTAGGVLLLTVAAILGDCARARLRTR